MDKQDIALLDQVELQFALADSSQKLEKAIDRFLIPLLAKLECQSQKVKEKIMAICTHLNLRLNDNSICLPVKKLVSLWTDRKTTSTVAIFALIYLEKGILRLKDDEQISFLRDIVAGISSRPKSLLPSLFALIIPVIAKVPRNRRQTELSKSSSSIPVLEKDDMKFIMDKLLALALYSVPEQPTGTALNPSQEVSTVNHVPPGLSKTSVEFITNNFKSSFSKNAKELADLKVYM